MFMNYRLGFILFSICVVPLVIPTQASAQQAVAPFSDELMELICKRFPEVPDCSSEPEPQSVDIGGSLQALPTVQKAKAKVTLASGTVIELEGDKCGTDGHQVPCEDKKES